MWTSRAWVLIPQKPHETEGEEDDEEELPVEEGK